MRQLSDAFIKDTANTIWQQIRSATDASVLMSWGVSRVFCTEVSRPSASGEIPMAALALLVSGFCHKGIVLVAYDEGADYYRIYTQENGKLKERMSDVFCEDLGLVLDEIIEKGDMSQEEYERRIKEAYCSA